VLAGGESSRMGFDKAQLNFHGINQVTYLHNLLDPFCDKVFISGSSKKIKGQFNFIEDEYDRGGPLNGILSAIQYYPGSTWLILPIDMPNLSFEVVEFLLHAHHQNTLATYFIDKEKQVEPLPVILNKESYPVLFKYFSNGNESLSKFLVENNCQSVPVPNPNWLDNINTPGQL
jgi:molybdopterin-guanine dinucleotide biosynthesis protein A